MDTSTPTPAAKKPRPRWLKIAIIVASGLVIIFVLAAILGPKKSDTVPGAAVGTSTAALASTEASSSSAPEKTTSAATTQPTTPTPTPTPTPTTPTSPAFEALPGQHFEGSGDDVVSLTKPSTKAALLTFACPNCSSNVVVKTNNDLLVNEIGTYSGTHLIDIGRGENTSTIEVTANGDWTIDIADITTAPEATSGTGDSVVWAKTGNKVAITHDGEHNFVVKAYSSSGGDLLVNEIGVYDGTKAIDTPAIIDITADGNWTITPS